MKQIPPGTPINTVRGMITRLKGLLRVYGDMPVKIEHASQGSKTESFPIKGIAGPSFHGSDKYIAICED